MKAVPRSGALLEARAVPGRRTCAPHLRERRRPTWDSHKCRTRRHGGGVAMSRTDKDAPYWVRTSLYEPWHNHCEFDATWWGWSWFPNGPRECDLPEEPTYQHPVRRRASRMEQRSCVWEPCDPDETYRFRFTWGPRPIDRRLCYWKPDRARVHAACDRARKEYNSFGQTEVEVPLFQHRHAETTGGGWWD